MFSLPTILSSSSNTVFFIVDPLSECRLPDKSLSTDMRALRGFVFGCDLAMNKYPVKDASPVIIMKLVIFGPPSAGKGTQAQKLSKKYGIPQVATGDLLRKAVADKTPLGLKIKSVLDQGKLGPDDLIVQVIKERVAKPDCKNGYLLDGFPRTMGQAKELEKMTSIDLVLNIVVDFEALVERAAGRGTGPKA